MKTFFKVLLYLLGFPLMIGAVVYLSLPIVEAGKTYGIFVFAGIGLTAVFGLIYTIVGLITWNVSRKAKALKTIRKATAALVICAVLLTTGIWILIDSVLPDILDDATSGTITYEDVRDDYINKAEYHGLLLEKFIIMNVKNKNLTQLTLEEYLEEGYRNEEVKELLHNNYKSLNEDGYATFVGPWLDLANDSRMTIPTIVHLVINDRVESTEDPLKEDIIFIYKGEGRDEAGKVESPIRWTILDMQEGSLGFDLDVLPLIEGMGDIAGLIEMLLLDDEMSTGFEKETIQPILDALNAAIEDEALAGSVIKIGLNIISEKEAQKDESLKAGSINISITPASESRGVWDYMHMAWLDSNSILFMVLTLFPARYVMLFFGGLAVIFSLIIGAIRERQYGKKFAAEEEEEEIPYQPYQHQTYQQKPAKEFFSPYMKACFNSFNNYDTRGNLNLPKSIDPNDYRN